MFYLYKLTFPNNKVYIGITSQNPKRRWLGGAGYSDSPAIYNAIKKHGWGNVDKLIIEEIENYEEACKREIEEIANHRATEKDYGYNILPGGVINRLGKKISEEHRKAISGPNNPRYGKKFPMSDEHRAKLSGPNHYAWGTKGLRTLSDEAKKKISIANSGERQHLYGKHLPEETKRKLSEKLSGVNNPMYGKKMDYKLNQSKRKPILQIDKATGEVIRQWNAAMDVENELGFDHSNIARCCNGKVKSIKGYVWRYADTELNGQGRKAIKLSTGGNLF